MAVTKIWPVRGNIAAPIDYIKNADKTANPDLQLLIEPARPVMSDASYQALEDVIEYAANEA